jgi:uncharacterized membrane protein
MTQKEINEAEWSDPANWRYGWLILYFGKRDTRLLVPKRKPAFGFTVNLGRREGKVLLLGVAGALVTLLLSVLAQGA